MKIRGRETGMSFALRGSHDHDSLRVEPRVAGARVVLRMPIQTLPWRDIRVIEKHGPRPRLGCGAERDPLATVALTLAKPEEIEERTGITGASRLELENGVAAIAIAPGADLWISCLRLAPGAVAPAAVLVTGAKAAGTVRVAQLAGGQRVGGVTLDLGAARGAAGERRARAP